MIIIYGDDNSDSESGDSDSNSNDEDNDAGRQPEENELETEVAASDDDYAYVPLECFYCRKKLFGDHQIAKHVFLQECVAMKFSILDPQLFQFVCLRRCPTVFPGAIVDHVEGHVKSIHGKAVVLRGVTHDSGTIEILSIQPSVIERLCDNFRKGQVKRTTKADHNIGTQWWLRKKTVNFVAPRKRKDSDPDYYPESSPKAKAKKRNTFLKDFGQLCNSIVNKESSSVTDCSAKLNATSAESCQSEAPTTTGQLIKESVVAISEKSNSDTLDADNVSSVECVLESQSKLLPKNRKKKSYRLVCTLCYKVLKNCHGVNAHLSLVHKVTNKLQNRLLGSVLRFQAKNTIASRGIYVCLKPGCLKTFHRRDKHKRHFKGYEAMNEHEDFIRKIRRLNELPSELLPENFANIESLEIKPNVFGIDFKTIINKWVEEKVVDFDDGLGRRSFAPDRMGALKKKLQMLVIATEGFNKPYAVDELFQKMQEEHRVHSAKTKVYYCRQFLDFISFSKIRHPSKSSLDERLDWQVACEKMQHAINRILGRVQSAVSCEQSINQEFKIRAKLSKEKVQDVFDKIISLLKELLEVFESGRFIELSKATTDHHYKLLQCCLVFVVANRNVSRVGSAMWLKKSFLKKANLIKSQGVVTFKCFDVEKMDNILLKSKNKKLREQKQQVSLEIIQSNKNFKTQAAKELILTYEEYWFSCVI